jgi:hypothetical protein
VALETSARRDGDTWVINGAKKWIGNGSIADVVVVWARDEADGRVKGFLLEKGTAGFDARRMEGKGSLRAVWQAEHHPPGMRRARLCPARQHGFPVDDELALTGIELTVTPVTTLASAFSMRCRTSWPSSGSTVGSTSGSASTRVTRRPRALAGKDRTSITAAHRHHHVGGLDDLVGPRLRVLAGDVDADLAHCLDRGRVHLVPGFRTTRPRDCLVASQVLEPTHRHLAATAA